MDNDEPPEDARVVAREEPRRCIDRRPSSWLLLLLLCVGIALAIYVILSAIGVGDRKALIAALLVLIVNLALLCGLNCARRHTDPGTLDLLERLGVRPKGLDELEENV